MKSLGVHRITRKKLNSMDEYIQWAAACGLEIKLDIYKSSGLQLCWTYIGEKEKIPGLKADFKQYGQTWNHHFRKVNKH